MKKGINAVIVFISLFICCDAYAKRMIVVPDSYPTIQAAVDALDDPNTIIKIKPGTYNESVKVNFDRKDCPEHVVIIGDPNNPASVIITSDSANTMGGISQITDVNNLELHDLTIKNGYKGEKNYNIAAIFVESMIILKMENCIVEVNGDADGIVGNYSKFQLKDIFLDGISCREGSNGLSSYHSGQSSLKNIVTDNFWEPLHLEILCPITGAKVYLNDVSF